MKDEIKAMTAAEILSMPDSPSESEIESEEDYRRGFWHGAVECIYNISRLYSTGYTRIPELINIIEQWLDGNVYEWRYSTRRESNKNDDWFISNPELNFIGWNILKKQILIRDEYRCVYCGSQENIEVDHILPIKQGGISTHDNLQVLCRKCNRKKGSK